MFVREITASGLFDDHLRQQSCLSWLSIIPQRLFHDKPGKNPEYSLTSTYPMYIMDKLYMVPLNIVATNN